MKHSVGKTIALLGALAFACASPPSSESDKVEPALAKYVLSAVPTDVPNPTFVDFGGKVHLVGWELSPKNRAAPGSTLSLKLYWRSVKRVSKGYRLYTHLTTGGGKIYEFDEVGPLRETAPDSELGKVPRFGPSAWVPGMIYVDEQNITVPEDVTAPVLTLSVGVKTEAYAPDAGGPEKIAEFKLEVLSGVSDGKEGALLARLATGAKRDPRRDKALKELKEKAERRLPGGRPGTERGSPPGRGTLGRMPGMDKENPQ